MNLAKKISQAVLVALAISVFSFAVAAAGEVDLGFDASVQANLTGPVRKILRLPDGRMYIGGTFNAVNGHGVNSLARFNADGTIDKTFIPPTVMTNRDVYAIDVQSTGKVLVSAGSQVLRLNTDGSLDTSFSIINPNNSTPFTVYAIKVTTNDSFYIGGSIAGFSPGANIRRYNADGIQDTSFNSSFAGISNKIDVQPDGKVIAAGIYPSSTIGFVVRILTNGTLDSSFANVGLNGYVYDFITQPDGKIVFAGVFTAVNSTNFRDSIARITSEGVFDPTFAPANTGITTGYVQSLAVRSDGKILAGGGFQVTSTGRYNLVLYNSDGTIDTSFNSTMETGNKVLAVGFDYANRIIAGFFYNASATTGGLLAFNNDGTLDTTAKYYVSRTTIVRDIVEQPDGKVIVVGKFSIANLTPRNAIARFNPDGTLDTNFNPVIAGNPGDIAAVALQPDGKILVGINAANQPLIRLNPDGSRDTSFNTINIAATEIVVLSDGKILVGGGFNDGSSSGTITRFNPDGTRDIATFVTTSQVDNVKKIIVLADGKFIAGGGGFLARFNANGAVDNTFNLVTISNGEIYDFDIQSDGKIIVVGSFPALAGNTSHRYIGRVTADGFTDPTFALSSIDGIVTSVKIQPDGKILIGGQFAFVGGFSRPGFARLNADITTDSTFVANTYSIVWKIIILNSGKIMIGGQFNQVNGISRVSLARLNSGLQATRATDFDFNGDGRADFGVFRPSNNVWYQLLGANYQFSAIAFGVANDIIAPADYDGDGKTDLAVFRPSTGTWWFAASGSANQIRAVTWGQSGDIPLPADVNGDGRDDYVVYRPSNSTWYRLQDNGTSTSFAFGQAGDKPLVGDFDGDGKADYAIYRPSTGQWWYAASGSNNAFRSTQWGIAEDIPVAADYDGDGKTDLAVFRPSSGVWYVLNSSNGTALIVQFGISTDKPVAADYDGDGKADIAVFRPSTGEWYVLRTTAGFIGLQFGASTDKAIPNAFVP